MPTCSARRMISRPRHARGSTDCSTTPMPGSRRMSRPADAPLEIVVYPRERGLTTTLLARLRGDDEEPVGAGTLQRGLTALRLLLGATETALDNSPALRMPPL